MDFNPTADQLQVIERLAFYLSNANKKDVFIIRGYAGTGKTTLISSIVKLATQTKNKTLLLAPTGRASKVMGRYSKRKAFTIHKIIYRVIEDEFTGFKMIRNINKKSGQWIIVDEASMIHGGSQDGLNILTDLISYYKDEDDTKIIFVGDIAQLPPVGTQLSEALIPKFFKDNFDLRVDGFELKEVLRQTKQSEILSLATQIRHWIESKNLNLLFPRYTKDIFFIDTYTMTELLDSCYSNYELKNVIVLTRSNKLANLYNSQIRSRVLQREEELESNDMLMVVKNNYHWINDNPEMGFIANGDIVELKKLGKSYVLHGFRFTDATLSFIDYDSEPEYEVRLIMDCLSEETSSLSQDKLDQLYQSVCKDYIDEPSIIKRKQKIKSDPFLNALQIKFAYAVTTHKAQGGQWPIVFVDLSFLSYSTVDIDTLRWLYTAVTRASEKLYFINCPTEFKLE